MTGVKKRISRRMFVSGSASLLGLAVSGCTTSNVRVANPVSPRKMAIPQSYVAAYGPMPQERFPVPAVDLNKVPEKFWRRQVAFETTYPVGTIIVNTNTFFLHLVQEQGTAMRYGVGLGRAGFAWSGEGRIAWKQEWPKWTPPAEMIAREPELEKWSAANGGMPPGLSNPLGARALYIFQGNVDTLYRIHGTAEFWSIGKAVSSGCVRLMNQDVIDLYDRVPERSTLIVI
ncbi:L,D-transpeptidase [Pararhizobium sp. IMCC21322]|uniref:L,D-transpeptidase n=1 Tax=Pararhizobium sp. IMCC21322 TaxID=3067903 RepID=UPI002741A9B1|nr:L,D-transpeptidase [Pararhizobium sp. IMCC21322]